MDISFNCEKCGQHIVIDETGAGQLVDCPKCGTPLEVPSKPKPSPKVFTPPRQKTLSGIVWVFAGVAVLLPLVVYMYSSAALRQERTKTAELSLALHSAESTNGLLREILQTVQTQAESKSQADRKEIARLNQEVAALRIKADDEARKQQEAEALKIKTNDAASLKQKAEDLTRLKEQVLLKMKRLLDERPNWPSVLARSLDAYQNEAKRVQAIGHDQKSAALSLIAEAKAQLPDQCKQLAPIVEEFFDYWNIYISFSSLWLNDTTDNRLKAEMDAASKTAYGAFKHVRDFPACDEPANE